MKCHTDHLFKIRKKIITTSVELQVKTIILKYFTSVTCLKLNINLQPRFVKSNNKVLLFCKY